MQLNGFDIRSCSKRSGYQNPAFVPVVVSGEFQAKEVAQLTVVVKLQVRTLAACPQSGKAVDAVER